CRCWMPRPLEGDWAELSGTCCRWIDELSGLGIAGIQNSPPETHLILFSVLLVPCLKKLLLSVIALSIAAGLGWWYFHLRELSSLDPAYREYAYITNGKSNTVSVIDLRTFQLATTLKVGAGPTGIVANSKKNEIYVVNTASNNLSVIDD